MRVAERPRRSGVPWAGLVAALIGTALTTSAAFADPQTDYLLNCRGCHGPDGSGVPGGAPSFRGQVGKFLSVPGGREYLIRVPGTAQSGLSDARIAALLNWIVREFSPREVPAAFAPYTADEVGRSRGRPLTDVEGVRRELLSAMTGQPSVGPRAP
jgi:mono/diheme cytochrome c family protein